MNRRGRPPVRSLSMKYSDWEVVEMYCAWRNGATKRAIAQRHKTNEKDVGRMFTRLENAARARGLEVA